MHKLPKSKYDPIKKLKVIFSGLHFAVSDFSVAYKLVLSVPVFILSFILQQWIDFTLILLATGMMLVAELLTHVTQKPKKVSETAIPSEIAAKP